MKHLLSDSKIYAMGGYDGRSRLNSCERYDPVTNQWEMLPSMHRRRSDASSDSLAGKVTCPENRGDPARYRVTRPAVR